MGLMGNSILNQISGKEAGDWIFGGRKKPGPNNEQKTDKSDTDSVRAPVLIAAACATRDHICVYGSGRCVHAARLRATLVNDPLRLIPHSTPY